jgi:hypothetical protein
MIATDVHKFSFVNLPPLPKQSWIQTCDGSPYSQSKEKVGKRKSIRLDWTMFLSEKYKAMAKPVSRNEELYETIRYFGVQLNKWKGS